MKDYPDDIFTRVALLESSIGHLNISLNRFENSFDKIDDKLDRVNDKIESKYHRLLMFTIGGFVGLLGVVAHGFHWY